MRILAFSDLHHDPARADALVAASHEADLVIGAGDFCNMGRDLDGAMMLLSGIAAPMVLVPGNAESHAALAAAAPHTAHVIHGSGTAIGGLRIFGLGHAVPPSPFGAWSCDMTEQEAAAHLDRCALTDLLVLHSPPRGVADVTSGGASVGSTAIRAAIERLQPRLALCGHVHDCWGLSGHIGRTEVANPGPRPGWFTLAAQPAP